MILADLVNRLGAVDLTATGRATLAQQASILEGKVGSALSTPPGGPHDFPWLQTGQLRDSIATETDGDDCRVASTSKVALYQEHGTATVPPRPTFAPLAAEHGEAIANQVAAALAAALSQAIRSA